MKDELTTNLAQIADEIRRLVPQATSVTLFVNSEGHEATIAMTTPEDLKRRGVSMKNLAGEWIK